MPIDHSEPENARQSRRSFLAKLGLGVAAAAIASLPLGRRAQVSGDLTSAPSGEFPPEDSIFHPASNPRLDPRRDRSA